MLLKNSHKSIAYIPACKESHVHSPGLVDFAIGLVNSGSKVNYFEEFNL